MEQKIYIVDDDPAIRDSLRMLLETAGHAVTEFSSATQVLSEADYDGGCLIADVRMPGMDGLELQEELARRQASIPVIMMTGYGNVPLAVNAMRAGAIDFIEKPFDDKRLLDAVAAALRISSEAQRRRARIRASQSLVGLLTARERIIMDKLVDGSSNRQVASELGISSRTVEIHRASIMSKLRAQSLPDLVRIALEARS